MQKHQDDITFHPSLLAGATKKVILTPNRRLAANLQKQYADYQWCNNITCWETPDILPLSSWLLRQWHELTTEYFEPYPLLLSANQERVLWQNIIAESHGHTLLRVSETADKVKAAYELIIQWQIDLQHPSFQQTEDSSALYDWILQFNQLCREKNWLVAANLPSQLKIALLAGKLAQDMMVYLYGFNELSPLMQQFLSEFYTYQHLQLATQQSPTTLHRMTAKNKIDEIYMVAQWAKMNWQKHPSMSIACVFPNLDKTRDCVQQIFSEVFAANATRKTEEAEKAEKVPFNISAGKRLNHYPIIQTALQLLKWHHHELATELFSELICSPYLGESESEYLARSYYNVLLREKNISHIHLLHCLDANHPLSLQKYTPRLAERLSQFIVALPKHDTVMTYTQIITLIEILLTCLGWPGERSLTSHEYQIVENWLKVLASCQSLDLILPPTTLGNALDNINQITAQTIFQPQTPAVNIQILGLLEAAGTPFDAVWLAGLDDVTWPPAPKPNPFIPKSLQRQLHMPHASTEREFQFCQKLLEQFYQTSSQVFYSYAAKDESLEKNVSPLIAQVPELDFKDLIKDKLIHCNEVIYQSKMLEAVLDEMGPPLQTNEQVRGGINILKHQALCPFRAFAQWRLHAHPLDHTYPGLRNKDRGTIIHKALEVIWRKLQDHHTLITLQEAELKRLIDEAVQRCLQGMFANNRARPQYFHLESKRMHKILLSWLNFEKEREPFTVIAQEEKVAMTFNNMQLSVRIDRIDQLANGKKLVIDYKTNQSNTVNHWFSERPADPQLPLYLLQDISHTIGITFAQILPGNTTFMGVSAVDINIKGVRPLATIKMHAIAWDEQLQKWRQVFDNLSADFTAGVAKVDPKEGEQTCHYCSLEPLCRVNELETSCH